MKKSSRYGIAALVIVAIICVMFCMPLGILIGKSIYDKPDNTQANNTIDVNNGNTTSNTTIDNNGDEEIIVDDNTILSQLKERVELLDDGSYNGYTWDLYKNTGLSNENKTFITLKTLSKDFTKLTDSESEEKCLNGYIEKSVVEKKFMTLFEGNVVGINGFPYTYENGLYYEGGCGGYTSHEEVISYNYKYTHIGDSYFVYQSIGVADPLYEPPAKVYLDINMEKVSSITYSSYEEKDSLINESNYNLFSQYKLEFELKNGNLIFKEITKIA
ncbi:MAG: hypothetical protein IKR74_01065 [Bacilli bacterium]|nr:hypothetical protein [Bacilli bacterium]